MDNIVVLASGPLADAARSSENRSIPRSQRLKVPLGRVLARSLTHLAGDLEMADDTVTRNLKRMDDLDFIGWNGADWEGVFARHHTDDVIVEVHGQPPTHGIRQHVDAMEAFVESTGGTPIQVSSHPIAFGSGEWTCVVGELEGGGRMVTVAKWTDGAIAEEYVWI